MAVPLGPALQWLWEPLVAAGLGLLIGLEREHTRQNPLALRGDEPAPSALGPGPAAPAGAPHPAPAPAPVDDRDRKGARTCALIALFGYGTALGGDHAPALPLIGLLCVALLIFAPHLRAGRDGAAVGEDITTEVAALACALLGVLTHGHLSSAVLLGLLITVVLLSKPWLRGLVPRLRRPELTGTLQLLITVLIVWPLMPDRGLDLPGPLAGVINLRSLVLFVTLTAGVGYVGYFMIRFLGPQRGLGVTGLVGGLTSSTAVTIAMGEHAHAAPHLLQPAAVATLMACGVMVARVVALTFAVHAPLGLRLLLPASAMLLGYGAGGLVLALRHRRDRTGDPAGGAPAGRPALTLDNPFELGPALKFGLVYAVVLVLSRVLHNYLGSRGLYLASLVAGLADVDSITLAAARLTRDGGAPLWVGASAVLVAVASNTVVKTLLAWTSGGWRFAARVALGHALALIFGGTALLWAWLG